MYMCADCFFEFEHPKEVCEEHYDCPAPPAVETFYVCPKCGCSDYVDVIPCTVCQSPLEESRTEEYIEFPNGDIVCNDCLHNYVEEYIYGR